MRKHGWRLLLVSALTLVQACRDSGVNSGIAGGEEVKAATGDAEAGAFESEVAELKAEISRLQEVIDGLQRDLAESRVKLDVAEFGNGRMTAEVAKPDVVPVDLHQLQIFEVNRDMKVSVINGGSSSGIKAGMMFHVLRGEQVIARLKMVDVRDQIAGGLMEDLDEDLFPEKGDRIVLSTKQD